MACRVGVEAKRADDPQDGKPGCASAECGSRAARTKCCFGTLSAKSGGEICALAVLQKDDSDEQKTDNYVNGRKQIDHGDG